MVAVVNMLPDVQELVLSHDEEAFSDNSDPGELDVRAGASLGIVEEFEKEAAFNSSGPGELDDVRGESIGVGDDILDDGRVGASELVQPSFRSLFSGEPVRLGNYSTSKLHRTDLAT
jgi:hypothetical protein